MGEKANFGGVEIIRARNLQVQLRPAYMVCGFAQRKLTKEAGIEDHTRYLQATTVKGTSQKLSKYPRIL